MTAQRTSALTTAIFVAYGALKACKPSEPFLTPYLINNKHLSKAEVNNEVYPLFTYAYFLALPLLPLLARRFGYRRVIYVFEDLSLLATRFILIFGTGLLWMQSTQITFALVVAAQIVYFSYGYRVFSPQEHQKMTSLTRAGVLLGHCVGGVLGQVLVSVVQVDLVVLFYISATMVSLAVVVSLFFPSDSATDAKLQVNVDPLADESMDSEALTTSEQQSLLDGDDDISSGVSAANITSTLKEPASWKTYLSQSGIKVWSLAKHLKPVYLPASIYALSTMHLYNMESYASTLWYHLSNGQKDKMLNGAVDAVSRTAAAIGTLLVWWILRRVPQDTATVTRARYVMCLVAYVALVVPASFIHAITGNVWVAFAAYAFVLGGCGVVTSATAAELCEQVRLLPDRLAKGGTNGSNKTSNKGDYVVALGSSTFLALGMQSVMQIAVSATDMGPQDRFWVYSAESVVVAVLSAVAVALHR